MLAGGLATIGVGIAGVLGLTTAATPVSALAAQMNQLAKVAGSQTWTGIPGPGQYLYTESQGLTESDTMANSQECAVSQVDIARAGSRPMARARSTTPGIRAGSRQQPTRPPAQRWASPTPSSQNSSSTARFPAGGLSFPTNDWQSLSTDPATLLKQVHQRDGGPDTPSEWFVNVTDFLRESDVPPAISAALYQALPLIAGVKLLGLQTDPTGQSGLGVGLYDNGQLRAKLIFDQQTARMLAEEYYDSSGKLTDWYSYTAQKIVDSVPNYPLETNQGNSAG